MTMTITVAGSASATYPPERARVSLSVRAARPERETATSEVATVQTRLRGELTELESSGALTTWSSGNVSSYSYRPWDRDGNQLDTEHVAQVEIEATFADLEAISPAVDRWLRDPLVTMHDVYWHLTKDSRHRRSAEVRRTAVEDAVMKAQAYADALGAGTVEPVEIADQGMLQRGTPAAGPRQAYAMAAPGGPPGGSAPDAIELSPKNITLRVSVEARFSAQIR
ncbi:DUF541 domain-containing protein [Epidermidibacterium keratini]|uniref:DUF541 domain-containing protein n=1 Tax=Epidermidibacterium keratini TaxID=1891644 RepID=A0A7L4YHN8_9ACTN|nr:SIMPL domain-containing protein [Epidermidibacterium keratini]QHB99054.1 DUF541 domain-containing protein [Epidermidibacterium keratini]